MANGFALRKHSPREQERWEEGPYSKGYEVHGIKRRSSLFNTSRIDHIYEDPHDAGRRFVLHYGDLTDSSGLTSRCADREAGRDLQFGRAEPRAGVVCAAGVHGRCRCAGNPAPSGSDPQSGIRKGDAVLPGVYFIAVRAGARDSSARDDSVLAGLALRCGETLCLLDYGELSGSVWDVRVQRNPV